MSELKEVILIELSEKITELIGFHLGPDHIHHILEDGTGYHYHIRKLKPGYPVLAMHYRGPLVLMLPYEDFCQLNREEITVDEYIATAHFNYGYYWGGGGLISGGYWQPFGTESGIHDKERISRYFHILSCRTNKISSGYSPTEERCAKCQLDATTCPCSPLNQTGCWENEVSEPDGRYELFKAARGRVEKELGFKVVTISYHDNDISELKVFPMYEPNTVGISFGQSLLNDLLYYPEQEHDWHQMAYDLVIAVSIPQGNDKQRVLLPRSSINRHAVCLKLWQDEVAKWEQIEEKKLADLDIAMQSPVDEPTPSLRVRISNWFFGKLGIARNTLRGR